MYDQTDTARLRLRQPFRKEPPWEEKPLETGGRMPAGETEAFGVALAGAEWSVENIEAILNLISEGLLICEINSRRVLFNQAAERLLGSHLQGIISDGGNSSGECRHLETLLKPVMNGEFVGAGFNFEVSDPETRSARVIQANSSTVQSKSGKNGYVIICLRDITREQEIDRLKSQFLTLISHEFCTPLTSVLGYSELLLNEEIFGRFEPEERKDFLARIHEKARDLERILEDFSELHQHESGEELTLDKKPSSLNELLSETVSYHQQSTESHQIDLIFQEGPPGIVVDKNKLKYVLDNLLSNAIKFSPAGGRIRVNAKVFEGILQVAVADQGIGMAQEEMEQAFVKFYRANNEDTSVGGLGLGLSLAKTIVDAHGGEIWMESTKDVGTTIAFAIPVEICKLCEPITNPGLLGERKRDDPYASGPLHGYKIGDLKVWGRCPTPAKPPFCSDPRLESKVEIRRIAN